MEIYLVYVEDRVKTYIFASLDRNEAEKIRNYINNDMIEKRGTCYSSIMSNIESLPLGSFDDYKNQRKILEDIIFYRTREIEILKEKLKSVK